MARLKAKDKRVIVAFTEKRPMEGDLLESDGETLTFQTGLGGGATAWWTDEGKINFAFPGGQLEQTIHNAVRREVPHNWLLQNNPGKPMSKQTEKSRTPVLVIELRPKGRKKNPCSCQVAESGKVLALRKGTYKGPLPKLEVEVEGDKLEAALKQWEQRRANPGGRYKNPFDPGILSAIGAAAGGALGAMGGVWTAAVIAAVGSLVGYNWRKITAGTKAGVRTARSAARNPDDPTESELISRLKF